MIYSRIFDGVTVNYEFANALSPNDEATFNSLTQAQMSDFFNLNGGLWFGIVNPINIPAGVTHVSLDYTATENDITIYVNTSLNNVVITLPNPNTNAGKFYNIKKISAANLVTVIADGGALIDKQASQSFTADLTNLKTESDGLNYYIL